MVIKKNLLAGIWLSCLRRYRREQLHSGRKSIGLLSIFVEQILSISGMWIKEISSYSYLEVIVLLIAGKISKQNDNFNCVFTWQCEIYYTQKKQLWSTGVDTEKKFCIFLFLFGDLCKKKFHNISPNFLGWWLSNTSKPYQYLYRC